MIKKYLKYIILFICLVIFGLISFNVYSGNEFYSDGVIYDFVSKYIINNGMTNVMKVITWFGGIVGLIIMCTISLFIFKNKKINISIICCIFIGTIINSIIKILFARERPNINPLVIEDSYSFPSGHSMISIIFYGYMIYLIYHLISNKKIKYTLISLLSILIILIGFSRIYLGVHYVSDVIGGFVFGIIYLIVYVNIVKRIVKIK